MMKYMQRLLCCLYIVIESAAFIQTTTKSNMLEYEYIEIIGSYKMVRYTLYDMTG